MTRGEIEDLRGSGFPAAGVTIEARAPSGSEQHHAFHQLPHGDRGFRLDGAYRRLDRRRLIAHFHHQPRLHQQPSVGHHGDGARQLQGGDADFLPHGNGFQ